MVGRRRAKMGYILLCVWNKQIAHLHALIWLKQWNWNDNDVCLFTEYLKSQDYCRIIDGLSNQDSKVHGASMGPTWVLSFPDGPYVGPMYLAIREHFMASCWNARQ